MSGALPYIDNTIYNKIFEIISWHEKICGSKKLRLGVKDIAYYWIAWKICTI